MALHLKEMRALYKTLPEDVQAAVNSINVEEVLDEIQKKYSLHVDQASELADETYRLMHGITHPTQFVGNIANQCRISPETAREIVGKINQKIFRPIRASLMKIHGMIKEEDVWNAILRI